MLYRVLRQIHLYSGILLLIFVVMYFVSGYVLTRVQWFGNPQPSTSKRTAVLEAPLDVQPEQVDALAEQFRERFALVGRPAPPRQQKDGTWEFRYFRPGYDARVVLAATGREVEITENRHGWQRTLIGMHRLHGYTGSFPYLLWAFLMDLSSLSMIVFAVTGVWMWFKLTKRRLPGYLLLGAGFLFTAGTMVYLLITP